MKLSDVFPGEFSDFRVNRKHELESIGAWVKPQVTQKRNFIVLGDMNLENLKELTNAIPFSFRSLNGNCEPTNTNINGRKPYDHILLQQAFTGNEVDNEYGFHVEDR
jgi:hypothetical protein